MQQAACGLVDGIAQPPYPRRVQPVSEAPHTLDLGRLPGLDRFQWAHEHLVEAEHVGPVRADNVIGVDDVAARLAHFLAVVPQDRPLVHHLRERLGVLHHPQIEEHLVPEARIEQVQHGVLGAADV